MSVWSASLSKLTSDYEDDDDDDDVEESSSTKQQSRRHEFEATFSTGSGWSCCPAGGWFISRHLKAANPRLWSLFGGKLQPDSKVRKTFDKMAIEDARVVSVAQTSGPVTTTQNGIVGELARRSAPLRDSNGQEVMDLVESRTPPPPPGDFRRVGDPQGDLENRKVNGVGMSAAGSVMMSHAAAGRAKFAVKSYTVACGYPKKVRSLVADAKFDTQRNRELAEERKWLLSERAGELDERAVAALMPNAPFVDFPRHISQLDQCNHLLIKYEPELDPTHPGFHDPEYRARRKEVAQIAFEYRYGERIPEVAYNDKEIQTWRFIYLKLKEAYAKYACEQHNKAIGELERDCGYSPDSIPQLQRVSDFLERKSGWRLRPAAGLLSARDFLASLAYRVFQTTQYIRHWGNPEHSVEPDCIHELMGHIPMLCDPSFAQFSQEIGLASLGASDEQIEKFATLYWFTVEFGLCREQGQLKCYGAGLLSSYGEMEHALESNKPALKEFVPEETAVESYDDAEYQVTYYVAQSFEDAKLKVKQYAEKNMHRDYELAYDPFTCSIRVLDSLERLDQFASQIKGDAMRLSAAISRIRIKSEREQRETIPRRTNKI